MIPAIAVKFALVFSTTVNIVQKRDAEDNWQAELIHKAETNKGNDSYIEDMNFHSTKVCGISRTCQPMY